MANTTDRDRRVARAAAALTRLRREWPGMTLEDARGVNRHAGLSAPIRTLEAEEVTNNEPCARRLSEDDLRRAWELASGAREPHR